MPNAAQHRVHRIYQRALVPVFIQQAITFHVPNYWFDRLTLLEQRLQAAQQLSLVSIAIGFEPRAQLFL